MHFDELMIKAQNFVEAGDSQKAIDIYHQIINMHEWKDHHGEVYFRFFPILFGSGLYDEALKMLIKAYELEYKPNEILEIINEGYYQPNVAELKHLYYENICSLQSVYPNVSVIDFEQLPLQFFPVSNMKFYIFDRNKKQFAGVFSLESSDKSVKADDNNYVIKNVYDVNYIRSYIKQTKNTYLIYDPAVSFFSYLQVVDFSEFIMNPKIKLFFTLIDFIAYFDREGYIPLSIININQEDNYFKFMKFNKFLHSDENTEVHKNFTLPTTYKTESTAQADEIIQNLKSMPWKKQNKKILLSIAILTWNRGHRALASVQHFLDSRKYEEIELVVCDNNSADEDGKYKEISLIKDPRLKYYKNDINVGFGGNIIKAIERSRGKFVYILSDEDYVNVEALPTLLDILRMSPDTAILKGSMQPKDYTVAGGNSFKFDRNYEFNQGYEALLYAGFNYNYLSGAIYNRDLVMQNKLFEKYISKVAEYIIYPHLYIDALLCVTGKYKCLSDVICLEGAEESIFNHEEQSYSVAYSYEGRLEQHAQFKEMMDEVFAMMDSYDELKKINVYLKLCSKMARLITLVNGLSYLKQGRDIQILTKHAYYYCLRLAENLVQNIQIKKEFEKQLQQTFDANLNSLCERIGAKL